MFPPQQFDFSLVSKMGIKRSTMDLTVEFKYMESKASDNIRSAVKNYPDWPADFQEHQQNMYKVPCRYYYKTKSYDNGATDTTGYKLCCEMLGWCGMSGWYIFLIVVACLVVLAAAGAALWFFYLNRFFGGKEEKDEEKKEDYSNTEDIGSVEISVATY
uniref:CX domain-containing protein n=2 Tax=Caenorhabditis tropicalis TaxID=1561998 RepID=A0A1I7TGU9_9PELO